MDILIAEDDLTSKRILESILSKKGYNVFSCSNGYEALQVFSQNPKISLFIVDWMMPQVSGLEVCKLVKEQNPDNPPYVILLTAKDSKSDLIFALNEGADDYISKPYDLDELWARLNVAKRTVQLQNSLIKTKQRLQFQAYHDELTGTYNRRAILEMLSREWVRAKRANTHLSIAMIDIDYFKKINDVYGHQGGDEVLIQFSKIIQQSLREYDFVGRIGGEEFLVISPSMHAVSLGFTSENLYERLRKQIETTPFLFNQKQIHITTSIGVSNIEEAQSFERLLEGADQALYQAKNQGRNQICYYQNLEKEIFSSLG
jgi:two-component system, cell cycle response regulator